MMKDVSRYFAPVTICAFLALPHIAAAQAPIPPSISTPDKVETRIGTLEFKDGMPSKETIGQGLRQSGLHPRLQGVREHLARGQHARHPQGHFRASG